jgi:hypothetical protein
MGMFNLLATLLGESESTFVPGAFLVAYTYAILGCTCIAAPHNTGGTVDDTHALVTPRSGRRWLRRVVV